MSVLPPHYTPGHYDAVRVPGGYGVRTPGGAVMAGEPTERAAAVAKATKLNDIRAALAHRP